MSSPRSNAEGVAGALLAKPSAMSSIAVAARCVACGHRFVRDWSEFELPCGTHSAAGTNQHGVSGGAVRPFRCSVFQARTVLGRKAVGSVRYVA